MEAKIGKVLRELAKIREDGNPFWNVPDATAEFLNVIVRTIDAKKVLEIGTSNGYSGIHIAEALSHQNGLLYTVESNLERFRLAEINFKKAGAGKYVRQVLGHAPEALTLLKLKFDLIFIDATKVEYKSYAQKILPKLKTGGVLISDNCISHQDELGDFLAYVKQNRHLKSVLLPFDNGVMFSLKTGDA